MDDSYEANGITLRKVREHVWEMPQEGDMRVPARVFASERLLDEISDDLTLQQLRNTTHLPGIRKYAICMPDGHQGYGFPVGGVAGIDAEEGVISPGSVGYDINCLTGDASILLEFGRKIDLADLERRFEDERAVVMGDEPTVSDIRLFTKTPSKTLYEVKTETGDTIQATSDHPLLTPDGMRELGELEPSDSVFVHPFEGIEDEEPDEFPVLTAEDFDEEDGQLVSVLKERDLLPLNSTDVAFNHLLKIVGFHTGDGSFGSHGQTWFYADPEDLETIREDIHAIGFKPSKVYSPSSTHTMDGGSSEVTEHSMKVTSNAFRQLLLRLGVPEGKTIEPDFTPPTYLERLSNWQRALYLSAFFGAAMNGPSAMADRSLSCPRISPPLEAAIADAGAQFLSDVAGYLKDLGIETNRIESVAADSADDAEVQGFRLAIKNAPKNLINFFATVGYRYNKEKQRKAATAVQYLKLKERTYNRDDVEVAEAAPMADGGALLDDGHPRFDSHDRSIERGIGGVRKANPRHPADFPGFEEFCNQVEVDDDLMVETDITSITETSEAAVYDLGVKHEAHNFVANGFVVSNCGVRMMLTNLTYSDVKGREEELVNELFDTIPSGLGGGGVVETDRGTLEAVLERGMDWALEEGYAVEEDLSHCEDEGRRPEADAAVVSQKAKDRGKNQLGSLGSGNHFLEVQRVTDLYLDDVAAAYGLTDDQIVVLIHCGSRGLGHQVCTDYLRDIEQTHAGLLNRLPDKELAAAPAGSQLADEYYRAMCAAINFAWVNRQLVMHQTREVFEKVFDRSRENLGLDLLYDVAHNIAKKEVHDVGVDGAGSEECELFVHRKGATRAFPAGRPEVPRAYGDVGQPIIIPGSMGAGSYVLRGGESSMGLTFGSTAHGAGRLMSRTQAKDTYWGGDVQDDLREQQHVYVKAQSGATIAEEAPGVYKDVDEVVRVSDELGIGDRVARVFPVCNIKG